MLGYPIRRSYKDFVGRYKALQKSDANGAKKNADPIDVTKAFFDKLDVPSKAGMFQFGKTKVFLNDKINRVLEVQRGEVLNNVVVPIQRAYR